MKASKFLIRHHSLDRLGLELPGLVSCYPFLVRPELECSGVIAQAGGGAGEPITSDIGGLLPIALSGLTSL